MITPLQLAGVKPEALALLFPAATTTTVPLARAVSMAFWVVLPQEPPPPRLILMTCAGLLLAGAPGTEPPEAQMIPSAISEVEPPHFPSTRTGTTLASYATPATP